MVEPTGGPVADDPGVVIRGDSAERHAFWFESGGRPLFAWLHLPRDRVVRPDGVVLCPPFGFEQVHAHRTLVHLADSLAASGFATLRFDYPGTGDSSGDESVPGLVDAWVRSIADARALVAALTGGPGALVGLRLGALLAGVAAADLPARALVAWAPVVRGRAFVREMRALDLMGGDGDPASEATGYHEGGGFRLSEETAAGLSGLDLIKGAVPAVDSALVVDRTDQPGAARLVDRLSASCPVEVLEQSDYMDMMAEPHFTKLPEPTVDGIVAYLSALLEPPSRAVDVGVLRARAVSVSTAMPSDDAAPAGCSEEVRTVSAEDGTTLFGVLCRPEAGAPRSLLLLPNAGSPHHVGPNRLYVELARDLAGHGVASFRFDLRNLGDSRIGHPPDENHPYPKTATADVAHVIEGLRGEFERFSVAGLCAGAHTAFHAGHELPRAPIDRVISINPLTFRYLDGMSLRTPASYRTTQDAIFYREAIFSLDRWRRLLAGRSNLRNVVSFVARWIAQSARAVGRSAARTLRIVPPSQLERDLVALRDLGRHVTFVFSSTDPGHDVLMRGAGATVRRHQRSGALSVAIVPDADHTFSRRRDRQAAIAVVRSDLLDPL